MILLEEHGRVAVGVLSDASQSLLQLMVPVRAAVVPVPVPKERREGQQAAGRRAVAPPRVLAAAAARAAHRCLVLIVPAAVLLLIVLGAHAWSPRAVLVRSCAQDSCDGDACRWAALRDSTALYAGAAMPH